MATTTRTTLLERLRDGHDVLAWDEFFARYWPTVYAFARRRGCSQHTAEEVVQDVMLKMFEQRDVYRHDPARGRFRDWLGKVVHHQVAEHRRRPANRLHGQGNVDDSNPIDDVADAEEPDNAWQSAFESQLLATLLDVVRRESSPRTYLAFELVTMEGFSGNEAARITGLSANAVYKSCKRVMARLMELGAPYRDNGRLTRQIKEALQERPPAAVARSMTARIEKTMDSR